jgi:uncharacterized membrane protein YhaH (DUF805 family)
LFNIIIAIALAVVDFVIGSPGIIGLIFAVSMLLPGIAVGVRRLHDTDRSGWWLLIGLVPLVGGIILLIFLLLDSTPETNRFGANPRAVAV